MKRHAYLSILFLVVGSLLVACGGGNGGAPVDMEKEETTTFSVERPEAWKTDSVDLFGISMLIASSADVEAESFMGADDPTQMFQGAPGVLIMSVPQEMADEGGDFGFSADEIKTLSEEEPGVEIVKQGDITVDGAKGYELVGKGEFETMGGGNLGVHIAVLEPDAGPLVFMGISPAEDVDKNLDIFDYMIKSIKFK